MKEIDDFTKGFILCALWLLTGDEGNSIDEGYFIEDLTPEALATIQEDCEAFQKSCKAELTKAYALYNSDNPAESAGHDFYLTRNGHGAGFWDRGLGEWGEILTDMSKPFGSLSLYVDKDSKLSVI